MGNKVWIVGITMIFALSHFMDGVVEAGAIIAIIGAVLVVLDR